MRSITSLAPLLIAAGILLAGNGLQGTLIALRSAHEGFGEWFIGLMGTAYFAGFMIASLVAPKMVRAVGHIRVFAALAAIVSAVSLSFVLWLNPYWWIALRFVAGFAFAGLLMVVESWLNASAPNEERGKVLSIYRVVDLGAVTGGQFLLPVIGIEGFTIFALTSILLTLSLVPISLADKSNPKPPAKSGFDLLAVWRISPIACFGVITIGMTNSVFRLVGPVFASRMGLDTAHVAMFMALGIIGGAILQFPLGWLSDKYGRRHILAVTAMGAALAGAFLSQFAGESRMALLGGAFMFGAFSLPLYSLSAAQANDRAGPEDYVLLAAGLMFFYSTGAMIGPAIAAWVMAEWGPEAMFIFVSSVHSSLVLLTFWRMLVKPSVAKSSRGKFIALMRTSPALFKLARGAKRGAKRQT